MVKDIRLYSSNDPMAKPNMPVRMPEVRRNAQQKMQLRNMRNSDERASGAYLTGKSPILSFKKGGVVPRTGVYKLHKGETVVPADASYSQLMEFAKSKDLKTRQDAVMALVMRRRNKNKK